MAELEEHFETIIALVHEIDGKAKYLMEVANLPSEDRFQQLREIRRAVQLINAEMRKMVQVDQKLIEQFIRHYRIH